MITPVLATTQASAGWILVGVAVLCFLEDSVGLGAILPAETVVIAAAATAANGAVPLWSVIVVAWIFGAAGDMVGFWIGREWGPKLLDRYGDQIGLTPERVGAAEAFVRRRGTVGVAAGRLIPAVRLLVMPVAGTAGMAWPRFVLADLVGVGIWATLHGGVGYVVGKGIDRADDGLLVLLVLTVGGIVAGIVWLIRRYQQGRVSPPEPA